MLSLTISVIGFAQEFKIYSLDSTFFPSVNKINPNSITTYDNKTLIAGNFQATDAASNPRQPIFFLETEDNNMLFVEDSAGFIFHQFRLNAACKDENNNIYAAATVNDNKVILKINDNNKIVWSKRQGHHSFTDIDYKNGELLLTGQDEDSLANHIILISKIDTSGNLLSSRCFYSTYSYDEAVKVDFLDNGCFVSGLSFDGIKDNKSLFLLFLDDNLNLIWNKNLIKRDCFFNINDTKYSSDEGSVYITGTYSYLDKADSSYILKMDKNGQILSSFKTFSDSNNIYQQAIQIKDSSVYIGTNLKDSNNTNPIIINMDYNNNILFAHRYNLDFGYNFIELNDFTLKNDTFLIAGNITNDTNGLSKKFYQMEFTNNLDSSCFSNVSLSKQSILFDEETTIEVSNYLGSFQNYPIVSTNSNINIIDTLFCNYLDTITPIDTSDTTLIFKKEEIKIQFTNPNQDKIHFITTIKDRSQLSFKIFDILGKEIGVVQKSNKNYIDSSSLKDGIYYISVFNSHKFLTTAKIIINHNY